MLLAGRVKVLVYKELSSREIIPKLTLYIHKIDGPDKKFDPYTSSFQRLSDDLYSGNASIDDLLEIMSNRSNLNLNDLKKIFIKWWKEYLSSHPEIDEDAPPYNIIVDEFQQIFLKMFNELFNEYNIIIELVEL
jgi:hypothetical protein